MFEKEESMMECAERLSKGLGPDPRTVDGFGEFQNGLYREMVEVLRSRNRHDDGSVAYNPFVAFEEFFAVERLGVCSAETGLLAKIVEDFGAATAILKSGVQTKVDLVALRRVLAVDLPNHAHLLYGLTHLKHKMVDFEEADRVAIIVKRSAEAVADPDDGGVCVGSVKVLVDDDGNATVDVDFEGSDCAQDAVFESRPTTSEEYEYVMESGRIRFVRKATEGGVVELHWLLNHTSTRDTWVFVASYGLRIFEGLVLADGKSFVDKVDLALGNVGIDYNLRYDVDEKTKTTLITVGSCVSGDERLFGVFIFEILTKVLGFSDAEDKESETVEKKKKGTNK